MRISVLASGSGGNCVIVDSGHPEGGALLIDAGISPREVGRRLDRLPSPPAVDRIGALFLTHEHGDHARATGAFIDAGVRVHATDGTRSALGLPNHRFSTVRDGEPVRVGELVIEPVAVPHDAAEPVGYLVSDGITRAGVIVDCGRDDAEVARRFANVNLLVIEFNYDEMLLDAGPYPPWLKRRIAGPRGHLSNVQAASLLRQILDAGAPPRLVVLAHLSEANNRPRIARQAALDVVKKKCRVLVAAQDEPTPWLDPLADDGRAVDVLVGEQLGLRLQSCPHD